MPDVVLVDFIKGFGHDQLNQHAKFSLVLERVNDLLREDDTIQNLPSFDVASLMGWNEERKERFDTIFKDFGSDLVDHVA